MYYVKKKKKILVLSKHSKSYGLKLNIRTVPLPTDKREAPLQNYVWVPSLQTSRNVLLSTLTNWLVGEYKKYSCISGWRVVMTFPKLSHTTDLLTLPSLLVLHQPPGINCQLLPIICEAS